MQKMRTLYIACQILGAVIGAAVVYSMFGSDMAASLTLPADDNVIRALILETIMTFTLVYVILTTLHHTKNKIAYSVGILAIGFTIGFNVILGGSVSGASMNPARSFGPALIVWKLGLPVDLLGTLSHSWRTNCIRAVFGITSKLRSIASNIGIAEMSLESNSQNSRQAIH